jgi:hypothetical protein
MERLHRLTPFRSNGCFLSASASDGDGGAGAFGPAAVLGAHFAQAQGAVGDDAAANVLNTLGISKLL